MTVTLRPSIFDLAPIEEGGVIARDGFTYQDHIAARWCLRMLNTPDIVEVWCESQDDITVIWSIDGETKVEFVQVKSNDSVPVWTVTSLCKREKTAASPNGHGTSILERSLSYDRCAEPCRFRLATLRDVGNELRVLKYPVDSPERKPESAAFSRLITKVEEKVKEFHSPNGRDFQYWLENTIWEVQGAQDDIRRSNLFELMIFINGVGDYIDTDQLETYIYEPLLKLVRDAAEARYAINRAKKRILKSELSQWIRTLIKKVVFGSSATSGKKMQDKMERANIAEDLIASAHDLRRRYRQEALQPKYLEPTDHELLQGEIDSLLLRLRAKLDAGEINDSGASFHNRCLEELEKLRGSTRFANIPPAFVVNGYMYYIADRCRHRFVRL